MRSDIEVVEGLDVVAGDHGRVHKQRVRDNLHDCLVLCVPLRSMASL